MSRRSLFLLALCVLAVAAIAFFPWTLTTKGPERMLVQQLQRDYGLEVIVRGRSTLALLPMPRIKVEDIEIKGVDGRLAVREATLRGDIGLIGLLRGQMELQEITLTEAKTVIDMRRNGDSFWTDWVARMQLRGSITPIRRLTISGGSLAILREEHRDTALDAINAVISWPDSTAPLSITGNANWNGKPVTIGKATLFLTALLNGKSSPFFLEVSVPDSELLVSGNVQTDRSWNVTMDGKSLLRSKSLRSLTQWANLPLPLYPLIENFSFEGLFSTNRNIVSWPSVGIVLDGNRLEGSLSFRFDTNGHTVSGTLAADEIDLSRYLAPTVAALTDVPQSPSLRELGRADLDLRLSATTATIGPLKLSDLALGLILKPDRLEATLGRASLDRGTIKGKLQLANAASGREARLQGSVDNLNLARLENVSGYAPIVSGTARGQITLEGSGATFADILRASHGKATLSIANGEIKGIDIPAMLKQVSGNGADTRLIAISGSSTPFSMASFGAIIEAGIGFITDGSLRMNGARTTVNGDISLTDQAIAINAISSIDGNDQGRQLSVTAQGPWLSPKVTARVQDKPEVSNRDTQETVPEAR